MKWWKVNFSYKTNRKSKWISYRGFFSKQTNTGYGNDAKSLGTRKMKNSFIDLLLACLQSGLRNMIYLSIQRTQFLLHIASVVTTNLLHNKWYFNAKDVLVFI